MLLETVQRDVTTAGVLETAKATVKATPKIFSFFSDSTYSNKPLAIARELVANAVDAHTAAGHADPVEVSLPCDLDPTFRVRDHGIGMSHAFMMNEYMALGESSTKDSSNDQIGGFGIGHWAPFAMVDQYTVRSVHDGIVSIYTVFRDETGMPSIGLLGQKQTDERNGVEVSFPVKTEDFGKFANAANEALKFFNPLPIVQNGEIDAPNYIMRGANWAINQNSGPLGIIMGGVRYPVATYNLPYELRNDKELSPLLDYGLDLTVPIGTCGVALSREGLSYTDQTAAGIRAALEAVLTEITASFSTMFDGYATEWEARQALAREVPENAAHGARAKLLLSNAMYRGQPLDAATTIKGQNWYIDAKNRKNRYKDTKCPNAKWDSYDDVRRRLDSFEVVILDDLPLTPKSATIKRIKPILVLRGVEFDIDIPLDAFVLTSSMPEPPKVSYGKTVRPDVRLFSVSSADYLDMNLHPGRYGRRGVNEIPYSRQPDAGILVVMESFGIERPIYEKLKSGLLSMSDIYFANRGDAQRLLGKGSKWVRFEDAFQKKLDGILAADPDLPARIAVKRSSFPFDRLSTIKFEDFPAGKRKTPFAKLVTIRDRFLAPLTNEQRLAMPYINAKAPAGVDVAALVQQFRDKQPLAHYYFSNSYHIDRNSKEFAILMELI